MITTYAFGKLYVAGEYGVLYDAQPAILMAVDKTIQIHFEESDYGRIRNRFFTDLEYDPTSQIELPNHTHQQFLVRHILKFTQEYCKTLGIEYKALNITIENHLIQDGIKIGLGSSAALTIALIEGILLSHGISVSRLQLYKLSVLCHLQMKSNGSFGDLASSCFGGWIFYQKPNSEFLKTVTLDQLDVEWPDLVIEPIHVDCDIELVVAWTRKNASTPNLVRQVKQYFDQHPQEQVEFIETSAYYTTELKQALAIKQFSQIYHAIEQLHRNFEKLAETSSIRLLVKPLKNLIEKCPVSAKMSGAGGGDCAITIAEVNQKVKETWNAGEILELKVGTYES